MTTRMCFSLSKTTESGTWSPVDKRPLSHIEEKFFHIPGAVMSAVVSIHGVKADDRTVKAAFSKMIQYTPLLQTAVEPSEMLYVVLPREEWPALKVLSSSKQAAKPLFQGDKAALDACRTFVSDHAALVRSDDLRERCKPIRVAIARSASGLLALGLVSPHHFMDGIGVITTVLKFLLYAKVPRILWPALNSRSPKAVPSFLKMALKSNFDPNAQTSECFDIANGSDSFRFPQDLEVSSFRSNTVLGIHCTNVPMKACREKLRSESISVSSIFDALAVKVMVALSEGAIFKQDQKPIIVLSGVDARNLGQWGDFRDSRRLLDFPVCANYAFGAFTLIPWATARDEPLARIAAIIKSTTMRVQDDPDFVRLLLNGGDRKLDVWCGSSCPQMPSHCVKFMKRLGLSNLKFEVPQRNHVTPAVWFTCATIGASTEVRVDLKLPIPHLTEEKVMETVRHCVMDSPIEPLFNSLSLPESAAKEIRPDAGE